MEKEIIIGAVLLVLLVVVLVLVYSASKNPFPAYGIKNNTYSPNNNYTEGSYTTVMIDVSDPAYLPAGAGALSITFKNASIYSSKYGTRNLGGFGPLNLLSLGNQSETIATVSVQPNYTIDKIVLNIASASVTVNGSVYNLTGFPKQISLNVPDTVVSKNNTALVELSPIFLSPNPGNLTISMDYFANARTYPGGGYAYPGGKHEISSSPGSAYLKILSSAINASNGNTSISLLVINSSGGPATVSQVVVVGPEIALYNNSMVSLLAEKQVQASFGVSSTNNGVGGLIFNTSSNGNTGNKYSSVNSSTYSKAISVANSLGGIITSNLTSLYKLANPVNFSNPLTREGQAAAQNQTNGSAAEMHLYDKLAADTYKNLSVYSNVQLAASTLRFVTSDGGVLAVEWKNIGNPMEFNGNAKLDFYGTIRLGNLTTIELIPNDSYEVIAVGANGMYASKIVKAS